MTAEEWVAGYLEANELDWDKLTNAEQFRVTMHVPCNIRCFRVGGAVGVKPGEPCPECGKPRPLLTSWERLLDETRCTESE